ncbi:hypothetical protein [Serratia nevei]|uniref:hypothetical protein n=1 Tax=Serratia nevei TaxID=2703794 RepID=UPI0038BF2DA9
MFKLFRTLCLLLGFWIATLLLSGAGVSFTHGYAAPKNLSHFVVSLVVVGAILLWTHKLLRFFFTEKFEKKPR